MMIFRKLVLSHDHCGLSQSFSSKQQARQKGKQKINLLDLTHPQSCYTVTGCSPPKTWKTASSDACTFAITKMHKMQLLPTFITLGLFGLWCLIANLAKFQMLVGCLWLGNSVPGINDYELQTLIVTSQNCCACALPLYLVPPRTPRYLKRNMEATGSPGSHLDYDYTQD